jgi:hypothetical protein
VNEIIEAFDRVLPHRHRRGGRGWVTFDCPSCGDTRGRGGFLETGTGGFRYHCFNGGCEYERSTGWEPGNGFSGRPRRLLELMGGDVNELPGTILEGRFRRTGIQGDANVVAIDFPEIGLPEGSRLLWTATTPDALDCQSYLLGRGEFHQNEPFVWTPRYPRHVIYPCGHKEKIVAWIGRKIDPGREFAHIKCPGFPPHYMLKQDQIGRYPTALVTEGTFDAIALHALCTFGNTLTQKQINLLNRWRDRGQRIALLPDYQKDEWKSYWRIAKDNGWSLSCPDWQYDDFTNGHIKDASDSIRHSGSLCTVDAVMSSITNDYDSAWEMLSRRST